VCAITANPGVIKALQSHHSMSEQMLQNPKVFDEVAEALLPEIHEQARAAMPIPA
jgi:type I restriction enzyme, R subunit